MVLIAILIALGAERLFPTLYTLRRFDWLGGFSSWLRPRLGALGKGASGVLLVIGSLVLLTGLAWFLLFQLHWLLGFAFSVTVLLLCLGPIYLDDQVELYLQAREGGDAEAAHQAASDLLHAQVSGPSFQLNRAVTESILVQANERLFAVLFWFAVLPPFGAALYRLSLVLRQATTKSQEKSEFSQAAVTLQAILDWVPARLVALGYATTGSFIDALSHWRSSRADWVGKWDVSNTGTLVSSGIGALRLHEETTPAPEDVQAEIHEIKSAQALVWRTLVMWIVIIALMVLVGWTR